MTPDPTDAISKLLKKERLARGWSLSELAQHAAVSKAMISKIERGEASPTATVLGKLSGAFGLALSALLALSETAVNASAGATTSRCGRTPRPATSAVRSRHPGAVCWSCWRSRCHPRRG